MNHQLLRRSIEGQRVTNVAFRGATLVFTFEDGEESCPIEGMTVKVYHHCFGSTVTVEDNGAVYYFEMAAVEDDDEPIS